MQRVERIYDENDVCIKETLTPITPNALSKEDRDDLEAQNAYKAVRPYGNSEESEGPATGLSTNYLVQKIVENQNRMLSHLKP